MNWQMTMLAAVVICTVLVGCHKEKSFSEKVSNVVTADIQAGIEKHIEEQTKLGDGYFKMAFKDEELNLKLVRVHTEYLANLAPLQHFACVDLASTDGHVYDVDFFLSGDVGEMTVTETTVHKTNGQPLYVWKQKQDKTWHRVPAVYATPDLLGIVRERDWFEFLYRATLPEINDVGRIWIPLPVTDQYQTIEVKYIEAPVDQKILEDREHGNKMFFMVLKPENSGETIEICYRVDRREKGVYEDNTRDPNDYLRPDRLVPENEDFSKIAERVVEGKLGNLARARALYDHTIDRMRYMKYGDGWGQGDAVYACDTRTGNCTDFHSYFIALSRAVGIPARFAIGASIPSERNEGGIDGYHCWVEFYTNGKWWPADISEGDKCSALSTYYFGHHPANRVEFSRGRDLVVEPGPASGPINFLAYPVLEIGGEMARTKVEFSFNRIPSRTL
jgi:transglutaminase-like putative cysteine protease